METAGYHLSKHEAKLVDEFGTLSSAGRDDVFLSKMRQLVKDFVGEGKQSYTTKEQYQRDFELLQEQLKDPTLREYVSFELMCSLIRHSLVQESV